MYISDGSWWYTRKTGCVIANQYFNIFAIVNIMILMLSPSACFAPLRRADKKARKSKENFFKVVALFKPQIHSFGYLMYYLLFLIHHN